MIHLVDVRERDRRYNNKRHQVRRGKNSAFLLRVVTGAESQSCARALHVLKIVDLPDVRMNYVMISAAGNKMQFRMQTCFVCSCVRRERKCVSAALTHSHRCESVCVDVDASTYVTPIYLRSAWNGEPRVQVMNSTWVTTRFPSHARASQTHVLCRSRIRHEQRLAHFETRRQHFRIDLTQLRRVYHGGARRNKGDLPRM